MSRKKALQETISAIKKFYEASKKETADTKRAAKIIRYVCKGLSKDETDKYLVQVLGDNAHSRAVEIAYPNNTDKIRLVYYNYVHREKINDYARKKLKDKFDDKCIYQLENLNSLSQYDNRILIIQPIDSLLSVVIAMDCVYKPTLTTVASLSKRYGIPQKVARKHYEKFKYLKDAQFGQWE